MAGVAKKRTAGQKAKSATIKLQLASGKDKSDTKLQKQQQQQEIVWGNSGEKGKKERVRE